MKYTKFTIKNYKGIKKIELNLDKTPNANIFTLVGLNESGKTSILEAINLFQHGIKKEDAYTLIPKNRQHSFNETISIEAELEASDEDIEAFRRYLQKQNFSLKDYPPRIVVCKKYKFKESQPQPGNNWYASIWDAKFVGRPGKARTDKVLYICDKEKWQNFVSFIKKNHFPKILYYQNFLSEFPEKIYLEASSNEGPEQKVYRDVIQDVLTSVDKGLTIKEHLLERIQKSDEKSYKSALDSLILKMERKLDKEVLQKWDEIFDKTSRKEIDISYNAKTVEDGNTRCFIEIKIKQDDKIYSIKDRSLGFRWFFSFLIFTTFRKSRSSDPGETLFLLDEPASNLHHRAQKKLLDSLKNIVYDCKLIYSTHSPHLINPKWLSGTYIVNNQAIDYDKSEEADIVNTDISVDLYKNFAAQYPDKRDHFKPILDTLDYVPSQLELVPSIILTEGKYDYYIFKYIADVIFEKKYELNFYPGGGVTSYEDIFRLYLAWNRKIIALFDSDGAGGKAKSKYIEDIGRDLENNIFTLEDVDKEWEGLETEKLFSDNEKINIIKTCYEDHNEYKKSKFNIAIEDLYIHNKKFELSQPTLAKFEKLFQFLKNKLNKLD